jgi:LysM repeat protein/ABC-type branched-subunit amino acid transport system substrate-binding protein
MKTKLSAISGILVLSEILMLAAPAMLSAQDYNNTPVAVSKEKVKVGGKVCYSHIVLEKQTLYSISKAYNVSIEEIYQFNPNLKETGLKKNSIILIPSPEAYTPKTEPKKVEQVHQKEVPETKEVEQTVEAPENVEVPEAVEMKDEGNAETQTIHIRKWYEDINMIADMYGVSVDEIISANRLEGKKLKKMQKLIIPAKGTVIPKKEIVVSETTDETLVDAESATGTEEQTETAVADSLNDMHKEVHATLLLPMRNTEGKLSRNNMDFYSGAMLAVYDLANEGINVNINTYDITDQNTPVTKEDMDESDIIIGPISTADLTRLFQASPDAATVVSPLDPRAEKLTAQYSNMIQIPTPHKVQYQDLVDWIKEDLGENDKVFMFSERIARNNEAVNAMKEVMGSSGIEYTPFAYSILEGRDVSEPLKEMMTVDGTNRIYIASESEAFVNDVVRNLNLLLLEQFQIVLYAPSKIRSYDTIEVEHFHKTAMHVSLTYYIDYNDTDVKNFLLKYRALYNTEPTQFAFQGYDIAKYFISLCHKYGKDWPEMLEASEKEMLQSTFKCVKQGTGGFVNNGVRRIVYGPNWTVTQIQ